MANQHLVRALVARDDASRVREELIEALDLPAEHVTLTDPAPADYRDEAPDLELGRMIAKGHRRAIAGGVAGVVVALLLILVIPPLRDWLPYSLILLFGGAWGGGIAAMARSVQVNKREDDLGEDIHHITQTDATHLRLLTITVDRDRETVVEMLQKHGTTLLDSQHPKVGRGPDARPATPGQAPHSGDHRD